MQANFGIGQTNRRSRLAPYVKLLLRWSWFVVIAIILTTACTSLLPDIPSADSYQATLQVQVHLPPTMADQTSLNDTATFISQLLVSPDTLSLALPKHQDLQLGDLQALVTAAPVTGTNIVLFSASGSSPKDAAALITDVYQAFLQKVQNERALVLNGLSQILGNELKQSEDEVANTNSQIQNLVAIHQEASFEFRQLNSLYLQQQQRVNTINTLLLTMQQQGAGRYDILGLGSNTPTITTVPASAPTRGQRLALSPLIGLIMGLGGVLLATRFSNALPLRGKKREQLLPHIAAIVPRLPKMKRHRMAVLQNASSNCLQLLRHLSYQTSKHEKRLKLITVTSPKGREGKSTLATCLATAAAQHGLRTLLVDANPRQPVLHEWFKLPGTPGMLDTIQALAVSGDAISFAPHPTSIANLDVLPIGGADQKRSRDTLEEPLRIDGLYRFTEQFRQQTDLIVFDSSSLLTDTSAANLAMLSDVVLVVVDAQKSKSTLVLEAEALLSEMNVSFAIVLNRARPESV
jgi:tyrosine-protein kinase